MKYIGIDPGASGGIASQAFDGRWISAIKMPDSERDIWDEIRRLKDGSSRCVAVIERVGGFIAGNPTPGSAMFKFGRNVGVLVGCLVAAGIPFEEITPQNWQKGLGIASRGKKESKGEFKNRLKTHAQKLFPEIDVTLKTSDSLLIVEFCRRKHEGLL